MSDDDFWTELTWKHVACVAMFLAAMVAMSFAPDSGCSVSIGDPTTTTTVPR